MLLTKQKLWLWNSACPLIWFILRLKNLGNLSVMRTARSFRESVRAFYFSPHQVWIAVGQKKEETLFILFFSLFYTTSWSLRFPDQGLLVVPCDNKRPSCLSNCGPLALECSFPRFKSLCLGEHLQGTSKTHLFQQAFEFYSYFYCCFATVVSVKCFVTPCYMKCDRNSELSLLFFLNMSSEVFYKCFFLVSF